MQASSLPGIGSLFDNQAGNDLVSALYAAGQKTQAQQAMMGQAYQSLLGNQMAAFQPAQNALSQIYGGTQPSGGLGQYGSGGSVLPGFSGGLSTMGSAPTPPPADPKAYGTFMGIPISSMQGTQGYADLHNIAPGAQAGRNPLAGGGTPWGPTSSIPGTQAYADFHKK